jgi:ABC-type branched-subunit amino acid transport system substrate-binding protein
VRLSMTLVVLLSSCSSPQAPVHPTNRSSSASKLPAFTIKFLALTDDERASMFMQGASLAADEATEAHKEAFKLSIDRSVLSAPSLKSAATSTNTVGILTVGGADILRDGRAGIDEAAIPVIELTDDLYDAGRLGATTFQGATPHSWQAWRLARYFGPADRKYSRVGLMREPGLSGESAAHALREFCADRGIELIDAPGTVEASFQALSTKKPQAVVIEGSRPYISAGVKKFSGPSSSYAGRSKIADGWRPQIAGFDSMFSVSPDAGLASGTIASGDYARPANLGDRMNNVATFRSAFSKKFRKAPAGDEAVGYDSVMVLIDAFAKAGSTQPIDREKVMESLEHTDRVRFARLPISLGPTDHVMPERDFLGLWAADSMKGWDLLMRTFTADLERTNIYDQDWMFFFSGSTPGGEAPFYNTARSGIVTEPSDDLR